MAIFAFFFYWNEFLLPLIYIQDQSKFPISVGISAFISEYRSDFALMMAASGMALAPPMVVFFLAQRYFIQGFVLERRQGMTYPIAIAGAVMVVNVTSCLISPFRPQAEFSAAR